MADNWLFDKLQATDSDGFNKFLCGSETFEEFEAPEPCFGLNVFSLNTPFGWLRCPGHVVGRQEAEAGVCGGGERWGEFGGGRRESVSYTHLRAHETEADL
eukprot:2226631-Rhodomonas_salina.1